VAVASQMGDIVLTLHTTNIESKLIKKFDLRFEDQDRPGIVVPMYIEVELLNDSNWANAILYSANYDNIYLNINSDPPYEDLSFRVDFRSVEFDNIRGTVRFNAHSGFLNTLKNERLKDYFSGGSWDGQLVTDFIIALGDSSGGKFETNQYTHGTYGAFDFYDVKFKYYSSGVTYSDVLNNKSTSEFMAELCQFFGAMLHSYGLTRFQYKTWYGWIGAPSTIALTLKGLGRPVKQYLINHEYRVNGVFYAEDMDETWTAEKGDLDGETVEEITALKDFNLTVDFSGSGGSSNEPVKEIIIQETLDEIYNYHIRIDKDFLIVHCEEFIPPGRKVSIDGTEYLVYEANNHIFDFYTEAKLIEL